MTTVTDESAAAEAPQEPQEPPAAPEAPPVAQPDAVTDAEHSKALERADRQSGAVSALAEAALAMPGVPGRDEFINLCLQAKLLSMSAALPKGLRGNPHLCLHVVLLARDLGVSPASAANVIDFIPEDHQHPEKGGQLSLSPEFLTGQVRRLGLGSVAILHEEADRAVAVALEPGGRIVRDLDGTPLEIIGEIGRSEFTWEDAIAADLVDPRCEPTKHHGNKRKRGNDGGCYCRQGYKTYPKRMMRQRAQGFAARDWFPECQIGLYCLSTRAEALTRDGWRPHSKLTAGDEILAYDAQTGTCRWVPVRRIRMYEAAQTYRVEHARWAAVATAEHRWVIDRKGWPSNPSPGREFRTTENIRRGGGSLVLAAPAEDEPSMLTDREAAIVGWLLTDGSFSSTSPEGYAEDLLERTDRCLVLREQGLTFGEIAAEVGYRHKPAALKAVRRARLRRDGEWESNRGKGSVSASIQQSKHIEAIRALFRPGEATERLAHPGGRQVIRGKVHTVRPHYTWTLSARFARELLAKAGMTSKADAERTVTRLSLTARRAMLEAMLTANGSDAAKGPSGQQHLSFFTGHESVMRAFVALCALTGQAVGRQSFDGSCWKVTLRRSKGVDVAHLSVSPHDIEAVWCPTTDLGTWIARLDGYVFVTGNSPEELGAVTDEEGRPIDPDTVQLPEGYEQAAIGAAKGGQAVTEDDRDSVRLAIATLDDEGRRTLHEQWKAANVYPLSDGRFDEGSLRKVHAMLRSVEAARRRAGWDQEAASAALQHWVGANALALGLGAPAPTRNEPEPEPPPTLPAPEADEKPPGAPESAAPAAGTETPPEPPAADSAPRGAQPAAAERPTIPEGTPMDVVEGIAAQVKAMHPTEVRAQLERRQQPTGGNNESRAKRLTALMVIEWTRENLS